ncbi:hypothetical protein TPHA_0G02670 [Tetrapisispora phaffii CBS 4417]|uniref:Haloacid dehalogenase-like hydrolase n=1 Tax=Tetrapisispora phaffii (strain ATCC 24235 / CBS 4417 / NBRC 1672 / NRRL Y-8282 / UCD 70-5) TaxID=1071381 RepID=G8BW26_TETPH|nr:hypothetical protein TPHA_0G02670 [Tetrapisispora phaffii CBS 4417]CCE64104.1 hypothetical protein TPHA_0G02670 [Tetrapisispora phaffii CBS 4417]
MMQSTKCMKKIILKEQLPKLITFDAYNTLYATNLPVLAQYSMVGKLYNITTDPNELIKSFPKVFDKLREDHPNYGKTTGISAYEWWSILIKNIFKPAEVPDKMVDDILNRFNGENAYTVYHDVFEILDLIKEKYPNIIVAIISNTDPLVYDLLKNLDLYKYFEGNIYLSYDIELHKPDAAFFDHCIGQIMKKHFPFINDDQLNEFKKSCWHIGDEAIKDMEGAANAGLNSILLDRIDKYNYLTCNRAKNDRDEHNLSIDKVNANFNLMWDESIKKSKIIQLSEKTYVSSNLRNVRQLLFNE